MLLTPLQAPLIEPVTLAEAKNHLRVDADLSDDDALITLLIGAARRYAEAYCGRSFITQRWRCTFDDFPGPSLTGVPFGVGYSLPAHAIVLERGPVQTVDAIQYLDAGVLRTLDPSVYVATVAGPFARITPVFGQIWPPISTPQIGNVQVEFTAGYGDAAASVPEGIRQWLLLRIGTLYANREEVAILSRGKVEALPFVDSLLDPYRAVWA